MAQQVSQLGQIHVDVVDDVPVLWAEAPPPYTISLIFRVGQADEQLTNAGITHLVEHLAFPHDHRTDIGYNGSTGLTETMFYAWGDPDESAAFLRQVSGTLTRLPRERIEAQRGIILTEESGAPASALGELLIARYGSRGPGVAGFRQTGIHQITPSAVEAWASRFFTADNAILCMTGPPPPRLTLELRRGERVPAPPAQPVPGPLPRWIGQRQPHVALGVVTGHDAASSTASRILERRLYQRLRQEQAVSYSVQSGAQVIDSSTVHRIVAADGLADAAPRITNEVVRGAYELAERGPTIDEVRDEVARLDRQLRDDPGAVAGWMRYAAGCYLSNIEVEEFDDWVEDRRSLTPFAVRDAWRAALATMILLVPPYVEVNDPRFGHHSFPPPVRGQTFHPSGLGRFRSQGRIVVGPDGISCIFPKGGHSTILFAECVAMFRGGNGVRSLVSHDGSTITVSPEGLSGGDRMIRMLDAAVPSDRVILSPREARAHLAAV